MSNMEFGESFDLTTDSEINANNTKKRFIRTLILSCIIIAIILCLIIYFLFKNVNVIKIESIDREINASGSYLYQAQTAIIDAQEILVDRKKEKYIFTNFVDNDGYISNSSIVIYDDGTYLSTYSESYKGKYRNERIIGKVNLELLDNYVDVNKEILMTLPSYDIKSPDTNVFGNGFVLGIGSKYYAGNKLDFLDYYNELIDLYNSSNNEVIQRYDLTD